jgi:protease IV
MSAIRSRLGIDKKEKIKKVSMEDYFEAKGGKKTDFGIKDKVAVVIAEGTIDFGKEKAGSITDDQYVKILRKIRSDDAVKSIVLRVNSGGGAALASDNILRELDLCREAGKPIVVSMGDYAASGGYLIACHADSIFADKNTITGSIGVFMLFPNLTRTMRENLGVQYDTVKTGKFSTFGTTVLDYSPEEHAILQSYAERTYEEFLQKVANGRHKTRDQINEIAQGRVWTGRKAKELGLVDELGGLDRAIASAAAKAGLTKYRTAEYPATQDPIQKIIEKITKKKGDEEVAAAIAERELGAFYPHFKMLQRLQKTAGQVQASMPFVFEIK